MRRVLGSVAATAVALVLVLGYKTHTQTAPTALLAPLAAAGGTVPPPAAATTAPAAAAAPPPSAGSSPVAADPASSAPAASSAAATPSAAATSAAAPDATVAAPPAADVTSGPAVVATSKKPTAKVAATTAPVRVAAPTPAATSTAAAPPTAVAPPAAASSSPADTTPHTYLGAPATALFGEQVQVQITVVAGKITDVTAVKYPTFPVSSDISKKSIPILQGEALAAQSARIDSVSGATETSAAFVSSLQSAIAASQQ